MPILSNQRRERFAQEVANGSTAVDAYETAGYVRDYGNARILKRKPEVRERINELLKSREMRETKAIKLAIKNTAITKENVLLELAKIGFSNIEDYTRLVGTERVIDLSNATRDQLAAIKEITVEDYREGRGENARDVRRVTLKLADKKGALVDIGRELGMFIARAEVGKPGEFANLTTDELADNIALELIRGGIPADIARAFARSQIATGN